jgi:peroxiredoxin
MSATSTPTVIADQVTALAASMAATPNEVMSAFTREQADLAAAGAPTGVAPVGTVLANADLLDARGETTSLYEHLGDGSTVVVFYRGAWCPYCNIALKAYQTDLLPELTARGVGLLAISPQVPDGSLTMAEKNALTYTVVSDAGNQLARALGVLTAPNDEARAAQLQLGLDLTAANADGTVELPMPTTVIVDSTGTVAWIDVHPDYTTRTEPAEILAALDDPLR